MTTKTPLFFCVACAVLIPLRVAQGGVKTGVVEAGIDYVLRKFGVEVNKELGPEGAQLLAKKTEALAAKYGEEESVSAVEKVGPRVFRLVEEVGEDGAPRAIKLMNRVGDDSIWIVSRKKSMAIFVKYGDDAADAMIKHKEIAEGLIERFGSPAAWALKAINPQNARRLAMLAEDGQVAGTPQQGELLETIGKYGDRAMSWIWNNKGSLATAAVLAKFIQNPQPFIDGTVKVVDVGGEKVAKPVAAGVAGGIVRSTNWTVVLTSLVCVLTGVWAFRRWQKERRLRLANAPLR